MPKIVLTEVISEISGILHYAVLMIPTGGGICVIGAGMPGTEYLWRAGMLVFSFRGACKLQILASLRMFRNENQYILPVMSVSLWAVFETIKKKKEKFSMKTSSSEMKSVIWLSVWLSFRGQICSCTTPRLDSFQLSDKHSRPFSHGIPFPDA